METNSPNKPSVQLSYPTDKLVAIIDAMPDAEQARQELLAAGFAPDAIGVQHGTHPTEHTVHYTDLDPFPHLARLLHVGSIEHEQAVVYEQALAPGPERDRGPCAEGEGPPARAGHPGGAQRTLHQLLWQVGIETLKP